MREPTRDRQRPSQLVTQRPACTYFVMPPATDPRGNVTRRKQKLQRVPGPHIESLTSSTNKKELGSTTILSVLSSVNALLSLLSPLARTVPQWSLSLRSLPSALSSPAPSLLPFTSPSSTAVRCRSGSPPRPRGPISPNVSAYVHSSSVRYSNVISFPVTVATPSNSPAYNRDYFRHWITSKFPPCARTSSEQGGLTHIVPFSQRSMQHPRESVPNLISIRHLTELLL